MKRFLPYFIVFLVGFFFCAWTINHFYGSPGGFSGIETSNAPHPGLKLAGVGDHAVRDAAKLVSQYVVNIDTVGRKMEVVGPGFGGFFGPMFGQPGQSFGQPQEITPKGQASGVLFSSDGYILTNNHVAQDATRLMITLKDGRHFEAKLIGRDPTSDLAVIKIDAHGLPYARFGEWNTLEPGDWVIAVGSPLGYQSTVTVGVVSAKRRHMGFNGTRLDKVIQTDAAINKGNSGGALADLNGNLVGINMAIASTGGSEGSIGIGFAIPSDIAKDVAERLIKHGKIVRPYLGVAWMPYNAETRKELEQNGVKGIPKEDGALVKEVLQNSPAADAGLQPNDIILKINGRPVSGDLDTPEPGTVDLNDEINKLRVGESFTLEVWHASNGRVGTIGLRAAQKPIDTEPNQ